MSFRSLSCGRDSHRPFNLIPLSVENKLNFWYRLSDFLCIFVNDFTEFKCTSTQIYYMKLKNFFCLRFLMGEMLPVLFHLCDAQN